MDEESKERKYIGSYDPELIDRLIRWYKGEPAPPYKLNVQITRLCNLKCKSCWLPADRFETVIDSGRGLEWEIDEQVLLPLVIQASEIGIKRWNLIGGEPLCRPELTVLMIREIRRLGMNGELSTNGTLFNEHIIREIVDVGWERVRFSIDCPEADIHDVLRGREGAYSQSINSLKLFKQIKTENNSELPHLEVFSVLSRQNFDKLPGMVELVNQFGVKRLIIQPASLLSQEAEKMRITSQQIEDYLWEAKELADKYRIETSIGDLFERKLVDEIDRMDKIMLEEIKSGKGDFLSLPCFDPWMVMSLRPNGDIGPCDRFVNRLSDNGSAFSTAHKFRECDNILEDRLSNIWQSAYFNKIRKLILSRNLPFYCADCCFAQITQSRNLRLEMLRKMGRFEEAEKVLRKAIELNPFQENLWLALGTSLHESRRFTEAVQALKKAVEINPLKELSWFALGEAYRELREYTLSIECHQKVLELNKYFIPSFIALGDCYKGLDQCQQAIEYLQKALSYSANDRQLLYETNKLLSLTYEKLGNQDLAGEYMKKAEHYL